MAIAIRLPAVEHSYDGVKVERFEKEIEVTVEASIFAHLKWEEHFQKSMNCDLTTYTERVLAIKNDNTALRADFLSVLKLLYCYIDSPQLPHFKDFLKLLDFSIADKVLEKLTFVLEAIQGTVSKN